MNLNDIIKQNETLSNLPLIYVFSVLAELEKMKLLKEVNDDDTSID